MAKKIKDFLHNSLSFGNNWKLSLLKNWDTIIGDLKDHVRIERIQQDTLILGVYDSSWLQELYLLSHILLKNINDALEKPYIKKILLKAAFKKREKSKKAKEKKQVSTINIVLSKKEIKILDAIKDEALRSALKNYLIRCYKEKQ